LPTERAISSNFISSVGTNALSLYGAATLPPSTIFAGSSPLGGFENNLYEAAGILLQLLLGTLGSAFEVIDLNLDRLRLALGKTGAPDSVALTQRLEGLQSTAASFNRYLGSVRAATTGIETVQGAGIRGAAELNDYADQVEDIEQQLSSGGSGCRTSSTISRPRSPANRASRSIA